MTVFGQKVNLPIVLCLWLGPSLPRTVQTETSIEQLSFEICTHFVDIKRIMIWCYFYFYVQFISVRHFVWERGRGGIDCISVRLQCHFLRKMQKKKCLQFVDTAANCFNVRPLSQQLNSFIPKNWKSALLDPKSPNPFCSSDLLEGTYQCSVFTMRQKGQEHFKQL